MKKYKANIINFKELRENAEVYIREVDKGESFIVMRRSTPIFKITPVDKWGDEGTWETLIDFTKFRKGGIRADELLKLLRESDGRNKKVSKSPRS